MTLKAIVLSLALMYPALAIADDIEEGKQLYKTYCDACHGATGGMDMSKRLAPPGFGVAMHYKQRFSNEADFVKAVVDWVKQPDASKSVLPPGAIRRFNLMPALPYPEDQTTKIARYMFSDKMEKPAGFDDHERGMGKRGKGKGFGKGMNQP